ncbi:sel1 repeat family protein [Pseudorhodobacter sp. E13]|uniref:sel1 repeat family protein n=1 Tax=Pseudorhodobacter sp. E13 TaxID=2487931 RepID=UPI000F8EF786|nr:sel1 repeat family protein [Pseudorhodobacter sp. E13]RUS63460.1 sel1 repeat family protein [Pseudorhodobacter sp. E13]
MIRALCITISLLAAGPLHAEEVKVADIPGDLITQSIAGISATNGIDALYAACPADIYASQTSLWRKLLRGDSSITYAFCKENFGRCQSLCLQEDDARACTHMARVLEFRDEEGARVASRKTYALACALGRAGGCTNRGAGLRNRTVAGDPMQSGDVALVPCLFRSFEQACAEGDSWGCAMSGQTYQLGEGVSADPAQAKRLFLQACDLASSPKFAACVFAQDKLKAMAAD